MYENVEKKTLSCRPSCSYNTHFIHPLIDPKNITCLTFPKISIIFTRADISGVIFIYTWDILLGHPVYCSAKYLGYAKV